MVKTVKRVKCDNLINKKIVSIKMLLLMIDKEDR